MLLLRTTAASCAAFALLAIVASSKPHDPHAQATLQLCDATKPSQAWSLRPGAQWGSNNTVTRQPDLCFDVAGRNTAPGTRLSSWQCCCAGKPSCGSCGNTKENYNQIFTFSVATGQLTDELHKMGGLCATAARPGAYVNR